MKKKGKNWTYIKVEPEDIETPPALYTDNPELILKEFLGAYIVAPVDDTKDHRLQPEECPCNVTVEIVKGETYFYIIFFHHSFDHREYKELIEDVMKLTN